MKRLLALLGLVAVASFSAPAHADALVEPDGDDGGFVRALQQAGFTFADPASAVGAGRAVCSCLNNGESGLELVHDVQSHNPGLDLEQASSFAVISAKFYCPHQLSRA